MKKKSKASKQPKRPLADVIKEVTSAINVCDDYEGGSELVEAARCLVEFVTKSKAAKDLLAVKKKVVAQKKKLGDALVSVARVEGELRTESQKLLEIRRQIGVAEKVVKSFDLFVTVPNIETVSSLFLNLRERIEIIRGIGHQIDGLIISSESFAKLSDKPWNPQSNYQGIPIALSSGLKPENGIVLHHQNHSALREPRTVFGIGKIEPTREDGLWHKVDLSS